MEHAPPDPPRYMPGLALSLLAILYAVTASHHIIGTDHGEFVLLSQLGGVAHPPGYPLLTLYLQATGWIPGLGPAFATSLGMVLLGVLTVALTYRAALAWGASRMAALLGAGLLGLHTEVWLVSTHAEAFAMNAAFAAAIVWLTAPQAPLRPTIRVATLGLLAGFALSNHHSAVLLAPVGLWGVLTTARTARRPLGALALGVLGLGLGLLPYGLFFVADPAAGAMVWGDFSTWQAFWDHVLRREYGTLKLGPGGSAKPLMQLVFWATESVLDLACMGVVLGALGMGAVREGRGRLALLATWVLCGPIFLALFNLAPEGAAYDVVRRFHVLPMVPFAIFMALGVERVLGHVRPRVAVGVGAVAVCVMVAHGWSHTSSRYTPAIERYAELALASAPQGAVVLGSGTHRYLSIEAAQRLEGRRTDVLFLEVHMLSRAWYVARAREASGVALPTPKRGPDGVPHVDIPAIREAVRAASRPLLLTDDFAPKRFEDVHLTPRGVLLEPRTKAPDVREVARAQRAWFEQNPLPTTLPTYEGDAWGWTLYRGIARGWDRLERGCLWEEACIAEVRAAHSVAP